MLNEEQAKQIISEFSRKGKISAIKRYMELTEASLRDSKLAVERLIETGDHPAFGGDSTGVDERLMDSILDAIQDGKKVLAVKLYRDATGKSLGESKSFAEALMDELKVSDPDAVGKSGCVVLLLMLVPCCVSYFLL